MQQFKCNNTIANLESICYLKCSEGTLCCQLDRGKSCMCPSKSTNGWLCHSLRFKLSMVEMRMLGERKRRFHVYFIFFCFHDHRSTTTTSNASVASRASATYKPNTAIESSTRFSLGSELPALSILKIDAFTFTQGRLSFYFAQLSSWSLHQMH